MSIGETKNLYQLILRNYFMTGTVTRLANWILKKQNEQTKESITENKFMPGKHTHRMIQNYNILFQNNLK